MKSQRRIQRKSLSLFPEVPEERIFMLSEKEITEGFEDYKKFRHLYLTAFPKEERVPAKYLMKHNGESELIACYDGETFCGFYSTLTFGDITHILFLAIAENLRDHGYGSQILRLISDRYPGNRIILDIEAEDSSAPNAEQRTKRRAFYERNGYTDSGIAYEWKGVPYRILIRNGSISKAEFDAFWDNLDEVRRKEM